MTARPTITCFREVGSFPCYCLFPARVEAEHILSQAHFGHAKCPKCLKDGDLREKFRDFPVFGNLESLFGLDVWHSDLTGSPTDEALVSEFDLGKSPTQKTKLLYAHLTPITPGGTDAHMRPLAPMNMHARWPLKLPIHVPKSDVGLQINAVCVYEPDQPQEFPLQLAIQAVDQLHRSNLEVACVLLAAAAECALRERIRPIYDAAGAPFQDMEKAGLDVMLKKASQLLREKLGTQMLADLDELRRQRNPFAHGSQAPTTVTKERVTEMMVSVAVLYEWTKLATTVSNPGLGGTGARKKRGKRNGSRRRRP